MRKQHLFRVSIIFVLLLATAFYSTPLQAQGAKKDIVIAMCHPIKSQIKNIEIMLEKDIIPLNRIKLICVHHEDGLSDYKPAYEYVKENNLTWVTFKTIKGKVPVKDIYKKNTWTDQFRWIFDHTDGIIFTGGADMPPALFNDGNLLLTEATTPLRSFFEASFLFHLLGSSRNPGYVPFLDSRPDYTVLGICLGFQTMNVACGGTMYQDIPSEIYHFKTMEQVLAAGQENIHSWRYIRLMNPMEKRNLPPAFHRIKFKKNSLFIKTMGMKPKDTPLILSSHHQALKDIGKNLEVIATSMDGKVVEAMTHKKYKNVLGIQFHPEVYKLYMKMYFYQKAPGEPVDFNLREYLMSNPPSMTFHRNLWAWFSHSL